MQLDMATDARTGLAAGPPAWAVGRRTSNPVTLRCQRWSLQFAGRETAGELNFATDAFDLVGESLHVENAQRATGLGDDLEAGQAV